MGMYATSAGAQSVTVQMVYIKETLGPTKPAWSIRDGFCDGSPTSVIKGPLFSGPTTAYKSVTVVMMGHGFLS